MLASALIPNAARGIKSPKVTSNAVMIGVVRIWTRSNRGASVGMVELCLGEEDEVGRVVRDEVEVYVGKGRSCLFSGLELEREPVMRRMEGDARDGMANVPCLSERRPCSLKKKRRTFSFSNAELDETLPIDVGEIIYHDGTAFVRPCVEAVVERAFIWPAEIRDVDVGV